ncbi:heat shock protein 27-like [Condylostylus longicornis]|uniref:heat shock protein 27-like n=1 Tax=Condylostylus longicornis TaxID=2530218 RepID=UPI00244DB5FD|nr:heat shock protein 27-like [Condylostylus longicornis]
MSFLPVMLRSMGWQLRQQNEILRHFLRDDNVMMKGFFTPEEIKFFSNPFPTFSGMRVAENNSNNMETQAIVDKDGFKLSIDVQQFEPNEVTVKTVGNTVVIEGKHEERPDENGLISRQFIRKYTVPENCNIKDLISTLSSDGILTVKAPSLEKLEENNERVVKIEQTGELHRKETPEKEKDNNK